MSAAAVAYSQPRFDPVARWARQHPHDPHAKQLSTHALARRWLTPDLTLLVVLGVLTLVVIGAVIVAGALHRRSGVREPGGTTLGTEVRRVLLDRASDIEPRAEALLFMASRAQLVQREIRPALARGDVVLLDRFFLSTYAYQIAGHGLDEEDVRRANHLATAGLVPDITILLSYPVLDGLARAAGRAAAHDRIQARHPEVCPIATVDAQGHEDEVTERVRAALRSWPGIFPSAALASSSRVNAK